MVATTKHSPGISSVEELDDLLTTPSDDLVQDLATEWVNNFVAFLDSSDPGSPP